MCHRKTGMNPKRIQFQVVCVWVGVCFLFLISAGELFPSQGSTVKRSMAELYSVWALAPATHPGLQPTVEHLRTIYGGPEFAAHVTVLGGVALPLKEAVARLQELAQSMDPITYRIHGVAHGGTYYQSVFLTVDPTPQVLEANARAKSAFKLAESDKSAYFPHLSLLYGDLNDNEKKAAKTLAEDKFGHILLDSEFVVSTLSLWATDTEDRLLTSWKKVAEYPLEGSSR